MSEIPNNLLYNRLSVALKVAETARGLSLPNFRSVQAITNKSDEQDEFDPVTKTDIAIEQVCRPIIRKHYPLDSIVGEELADEIGESGWAWYLDPIDGTRAYIAGLPFWTTLIGVLDDKQEFSLGLVDVPALNERYIGYTNYAKLEQGGCSRDIRVSECRTLSDATVSTTDPFILNQSEQVGWRNIRKSARIVRYGLDAYAYARLAAGSIDLVVESGLLPWDMCALVPLVRGAGGIVCDWDGSEPKLGGRIVCASTLALMDEALGFLSKC